MAVLLMFIFYFSSTLTFNLSTHIAYSAVNISHMKPCYLHLQKSLVYKPNGIFQLLLRWISTVMATEVSHPKWI